MLDRFRSQSVSRILILVCVIVAVVPLSLLGVHLYNAAWQDSWREIREKHQLLAQNLTAPIYTYVTDHQKMLSLISDSIIKFDERPGETAELLERTQTTLNGFRSLVLLDLDGNIVAIAHDKDGLETSLAHFQTEACFLKTRESGQWTISKVKRDPITQLPSIYMGQPVFDGQGQLKGVLLGELKIDYIESLRANVKFGENGHSAIVDQTGQVIAHPNSAWMTEIKDLSNISVVKEMMLGGTGVTEFYSPFVKADMVAGYASVPEFGWGIMVPQPKSEVEARVDALMRSNIMWGIAGLILAVLLALYMARWILRPLNKLADASRELVDSGLEGSLPTIDKNSPKEVRQLGSVLQTLVSDLQKSRDEVHALNSTLSIRVVEATQQLLESNRKLEEIARQDHLTEIANRRYFENSLSQTLSRRSGDINHVCVILVDIDHFKQINDSYGHAAGDRVLNNVARILENSMRPNDLVARYGGDEFVAYMRCDHDIGLTRAKEIRTAIEAEAIHWNDRSIHISASIGLFCQTIGDNLEVDNILNQADHAMYQAKKAGRNRVVDISQNA